MITTTVNEDFKKSLVNEMVQQLVPILLQEIKKNELPHLLSRKEFMELAGIGESKCNELFHRKDFPVNRELGHPKVETKAFFEWINETNQNAKGLNLQYPYGVG